jgi:hypothetical protein
MSHGSWVAAEAAPAPAVTPTATAPATTSPAAAAPASSLRRQCTNPVLNFNFLSSLFRISDF